MNAQNGPLTEYEVTYAQGTFSSVPASDSVRIQAALEDSASLTGLQEYVQYRISVTAYNADGAGPSSAEVIVTTYQDGKILLYWYIAGSYTVQNAYKRLSTVNITEIQYLIVI